MSTDNQPTILIKYGVFLYVVTYARWVSYYVLYVLFCIDSNMNYGCAQILCSYMLI